MIYFVGRRAQYACHARGVVAFDLIACVVDVNAYVYGSR